MDSVKYQKLNSQLLQTFSKAGIKQHKLKKETNKKNIFVFTVVFRPVIHSFFLHFPFLSVRSVMKY